MSVVISYILRLRHDEKDDFLPVEKIILMTFRFSNLSLLLSGISSSFSDRRYPGQKKIFQRTQTDSGFFEQPLLNRFDDESEICLLLVLFGLSDAFLVLTRSFYLVAQTGTKIVESHFGIDL